MLINELRLKEKMSIYQLARVSGLPYATVNDICNGKSAPAKCSAGTLYQIAKVLHISVEEILESAEDGFRSTFETFKSNTCHRVKDMGDEDFMIWVLETDEIRSLYERKWYPESLYLLAMLDFLSRENDIPLCTRYDDLRVLRLQKPIYPIGVLLTSRILGSDAPLRKAEREAIPEFRRFNIIESEVRNVV